jgi:hypothetical protein
MSDTATTPFSNKAAILAEVWMNYRSDEDFQDFVEYNDLGLPLAYAIAENIIPATDRAKRFIEETFDILLAGLNLEDEGFETLTAILEKAKSESE